MMDGGREGRKNGQGDEFSHEFSKCLLRAYCVPGTVLGTGDTPVSTTQTSLPS